MSIKKYTASKDTTITNAFKEGLQNRGIYANMGAADSLEVFSIYGQATTSSIEKSRILVEFPINDIINDRNLYKLPSSGNVQFYLKLYNVVHPFSVPRNFTLNVNPISGSWIEGYGLDMEGYTDLGFVDNINNSYGTNWILRNSGTYWNNQGGDYHTSSNYNFSYNFNSGLEDLEINITNVVEDWISGTLPNNGFIVYLSSTLEDGSTKESFYTKKFSARGSEYFYSRPSIEARWNPSVTDDRNNFCL